MSAYQGWVQLLHLPATLEGPGVFFISMIFFLIFIFLPFSLTLEFIERKMVADLQARVGPNRTVGSGFFQPLADLMKMFSKTHSQPADGSTTWALLQSASIYSIFAILPLGSSFLFLNSELSALIAMVCLSVLFLATAMAGLKLESITGILAAFKSTYHFFSGIIPSFICLLTVGALSGSLNWIVIGTKQDGGPGSWNVFSNPFGAISFIVFILSGFLMFQFPPFHTADQGAANFWGRRLALYKINRSFLVLAWMVFASVLYLGAWDFLGDEPAGFFGAFLELNTVLLKTFFIVLMTRVISRSFPQIRMDQATDFSWKVLTPLSLICLLGATLWAGGVK
jgi:NADH-quinone oxidoreductase subunit H